MYFLILLILLASRFIILIFFVCLFIFIVFCFTLFFFYFYFISLHASFLPPSPIFPTSSIFPGSFLPLLLFPSMQPNTWFLSLQLSHLSCTCSSFSYHDLLLFLLLLRLFPVLDPDWFCFRFLLLQFILLFPVLFFDLAFVFPFSISSSTFSSSSSSP